MNNGDKFKEWWKKYTFNSDDVFQKTDCKFAWEEARKQALEEVIELIDDYKYKKRHRSIFEFAVALQQELKTKFRIKE